MRTLPILWRMAEDLRRLAMPSSMFFEYPFASTYRLTPWNHLVKNDLTKISKDGYQVSMNVAEFKPEELTVKVADNHVIVEGKSEHQHDDDSGYVSRHFVRRLPVPDGFEVDNAISTLSSDGVLTVSIPMPQIEGNAREIPIQRVEESIKLKNSAEESINKKENLNLK